MKGSWLGLIVAALLCASVGALAGQITEDRVRLYGFEITQEGGPATLSVKVDAAARAVDPQTGEVIDVRRRVFDITGDLSPQEKTQIRGFRSRIVEIVSPKFGVPTPTPTP